MVVVVVLDGSGGGCKCLGLIPFFVKVLATPLPPPTTTTTTATTTTLDYRYVVVVIAAAAAAVVVVVVVGGSVTVLRVFLGVC